MEIVSHGLSEESLSALNEWGYDLNSGLINFTSSIAKCWKIDDSIVLCFDKNERKFIALNSEKELRSKIQLKHGNVELKESANDFEVFRLPSMYAFTPRKDVLEAANFLNRSTDVNSSVIGDIGFRRSALLKYHDFLHSKNTRRRRNWKSNTMYINRYGTKFELSFHRGMENYEPSFTINRQSLGIRGEDACVHGEKCTTYLRREIEFDGSMVRGRIFICGEIDAFEGCTPVEIKTIQEYGRFDFEKALLDSWLMGTKYHVVRVSASGKIVSRISYSLSDLIILVGKDKSKEIINKLYITIMSLIANMVSCMSSVGADEQLLCIQLALNYKTGKVEEIPYVCKLDNLEDR